MKAHISSAIKARVIRGAFYLLLLLTLCVIPFALTQRTTAKANKPTNVITVINGNDSGTGLLRQALADAILRDRHEINVNETGASLV